MKMFCPLKQNKILVETLMPGKIEAGGEGDDRGRDGWMV